MVPFCTAIAQRIDTLPDLRSPPLLKDDFHSALSCLSVYNVPRFWGLPHVLVRICVGERGLGYCRECNCYLVYTLFVHAVKCLVCDKWTMCGHPGSYSDGKPQRRTKPAFR